MEDMETLRGNSGLAQLVFPRWKEIKSFLGVHNFPSTASVNSSQTTCSWWGLKRTYPLHIAAREENWHMYSLLVKFGANSYQSLGWC